MATAEPDREIVIQAAADLHGALPDVPRCDLLILAGDLVPYGVERDPDRTRAWFSEEFAAWLGTVPADEVIGIAGNHDFWAPQISAGAHEGLLGARWTYLQDAETTTRSGLRVYGSPWTREEYGTAFEAPGSELARIWAVIPADLDVLVVHSPPRGHGDSLTGDGGALTMMGAEELTTAITRARPRLVVYGHAHEAYGYRAEDPAGTTLANVTMRTDYAGGLHHLSTFRLAAR